MRVWTGEPDLDVMTVSYPPSVSGAEESQGAVGDKQPPRKPVGKKERRVERRKVKQGYGLGMETKLVWEQLRRWVGLHDVCSRIASTLLPPGQARRKARGEERAVAKTDETHHRAHA